MRTGFAVKLAAAAAVAFLSIPSHAHHGAAAYDGSQTVTVSGEVSDFQFVNPHVLIYAEVANADGSVTEWAGELTSPNRLARAINSNVRWHKDILKPGEQVSLTGNPARNGAPFLRLLKVVDGSGRVLLGGDE